MDYDAGIMQFPRRGWGGLAGDGATGMVRRQAERRQGVSGGPALWALGEREERFNIRVSYWVDDDIGFECYTIDVGRRVDGGSEG